MKIVIIAVIAALVTMLVLFILDKRKKIALDDVKPERKEKVDKRIEPIVNELGLPFYDRYEMNKTQKITSCLLAGIVLFCVGYLFYMNLVISILFALICLLFPRIRIKQIIAKRKRNLTTQFKHLLSSISSSLAAGKSVENSFKAAVDDLNMLYPSEETDILKEARWIVHKIELNEPIEIALNDFAERANIDEIASFANVFVACKRTGGDLVKVVRSTSNIIQEKIEIKNDINVAIAAKKTEQKFLMVVPFIIIGFLVTSSGDFMRPMYTTLIGRIVMTLGWLVIMGVWFITERIMDIKV